MSNESVHGQTLSSNTQTFILPPGISQEEVEALVAGFLQHAKSIRYETARDQCDIAQTIARRLGSESEPKPKTKPEPRPKPEHDTHTVIEVREVKIDLKSRVATSSGRRLTLTALEFDLLAFLMEHAGQVVSKRQIFREVWKRELIVPEKTIVQHVLSLRRKLDAADRERYIQTERGLGYMFAK